MYITASHLVSLYSGKSFTAFVKERIFDPLHMSTTTYRWDEAEKSQLFSQAWSGAEHRRIPYWFAGEKVSEFIAGAGGVISSATDMVCLMIWRTAQNADTSQTDKMACDASTWWRQSLHESHSRAPLCLRRDDQRSFDRAGSACATADIYRWLRHGMDAYVASWPRCKSMMWVFLRVVLIVCAGNQPRWRTSGIPIGRHLPS